MNNNLELKDEDQIILKWRANISKSDVNTVCDFHKNKFGEAFVSKYKAENICMMFMRSTGRRGKGKQKVGTW